LGQLVADETNPGLARMTDPPHAVGAMGIFYADSYWTLKKRVIQA